MKPKSLIRALVLIGLTLVAYLVLVSTSAIAAPALDRSGPEGGYVQAVGDAWLPGHDLSACFDMYRMDAEYFPGNGWVYILGGRTDSTNTDGSIYRFRPDTGTCQDTGVDMPTPISNYTISLVNDGTDNLLCTFGGRDASGNPTPNVQCFNPGTNTVSVVATLPAAFAGYFPGGQAVVDNRVYVFGGYNSFAAPYHLAATYRFNPLDNSFTQVGDLNLARAYINTAVVDGKIYAFGGTTYDGIGLISQVISEVMADPAGAGTWDDAAVPDLPLANGEGSAFGFDSNSIYGQLVAGKVILTGGGIWPDQTAAVLAYDVASATYDESFPDLITARRNHAGVFVPGSTANTTDGLPGIWVIGGRIVADAQPFGPAEVFPLEAPKLWRQGADISACFDLYRIDAEYDPGTELVYILGGRSGTVTDGSIYSFDPATGNCADTGTDMPTPISNYTVALLNDGTNDLLCTFGGRDAGGTPTLDVQCYHPATNAVSVVATLPTDFTGYFPGGVAVVDNRAYVFGGFNAVASPYNLAATYRFNPLNNTFTQLGDLSLARQYINVAVVDGKIYAFGGTTYDGALYPQAIAEVMADPGGAGTWDDAAVADLPTTYDEGIAFGFDSDSPYNLAGKIVIAGGGWTVATAAALTYDVASDTYDITFPDLITARRNFAGAFVPLVTENASDGLPGMWVFGGWVSSDNPPYGLPEYYPMSERPAQIAVAPLALDVTVYLDTPNVETLSLENPGYLPLDWGMLEFTATQSVSNTGCLVALFPAGIYITETAALEDTLADMGFAYAFVDGAWEAGDIGADVILNRYASDNSAAVVDIDDWLAAGYGYIQLGDWSNWFDNSYDNVTNGDPVDISVADATHPLAANLPASWVGRGFWAYEWSLDALGWATEATYPNIVQAQYTVLRERVVTGVEVGPGRAVYIGINTYGPAATAPDMQVLYNALRWSGRCNPAADLPWLWESPVAGAVNGGDSYDVDIHFDPTGMAPGTYYGTLGVQSNAEAQPLVNVPVTMTVLPYRVTFLPTMVKR